MSDQRQPLGLPPMPLRSSRQPPIEFGVLLKNMAGRFLEFFVQRGKEQRIHSLAEELFGTSASLHR